MQWSDWTWITDTSASPLDTFPLHSEGNAGATLGLAIDADAVYVRAPDAAGEMVSIAACNHAGDAQLLYRSNKCGPSGVSYCMRPEIDYSMVIISCKDRKLS